jgi:hypothetical protein
MVRYDTGTGPLQIPVGWHGNCEGIPVVRNGTRKSTIDCSIGKLQVL